MSSPSGPSASRPLAAFIERSRRGRTIYELNGGAVSVYRNGLMGRSNLVFRLDELEGRAEITSGRYLGKALGNLIPGAALAGAAVWACFGAPSELVEPMQHILRPVALASIVPIGNGLRWLPRLNEAHFHYEDGKLAFSIIREREQAADFDEFVASVERAIAGGD